MTDEQTQPQAGNVETPATPDASGPEAQSIDELPEWARKLVRELRQENAQHRTEKRAAEHAADEAERKRLADQQQWKELAEKLQADMAALRPQVDAAQAYRDTIAATVEARIKAVPEQMRSLVPAFDDPAKTLQWLDANAAVLSTPRPPQMDAGVGGDTGKNIALTPEEMEMAQRMNIAPEKMLAQKRQLQRSAPPAPDKKPSGV